MRRGLALLALLVAGYLAVTAAQVWQASTRAANEAPDAAGAIIVLGAAQYDGRPSPALQQRLDHAAALYDAEVAPIIVVTGGNQPGDRFTEAAAAATYLVDHSGVPESAIRREVEGRNSYLQVAASARFLREEGIEDVVLVSHPLHARRLALIAAEVGLDGAVSATTGTRELSVAARETAAVAVGQVIGFRRLTELTTTR